MTLELAYVYAAAGRVAEAEAIVRQLSPRG